MSDCRSAQQDGPLPEDVRVDDIFTDEVLEALLEFF